MGERFRVHVTQRHLAVLDEETEVASHCISGLVYHH